MKERIQKVIASTGLCSRRSAEKLISEGKVTVNGITASLGDCADIFLDKVCVDGRLLTAPDAHTYIMLNKPRGYVTTMSDEKGRRCVAELVKDVGVRVYPVGRLDMYSDGLLIMTDDGELANRLMHPSGEVRKTYRLRTDSAVTEDALRILRSPLIIDGKPIKPAEVVLVSNDNGQSVLSVTIHEGRNRQVRKMCEAAGLHLTRLTRIEEGPLSLGDLKPGKWRYLTDVELHKLLSTVR